MTNFDETNIEHDQLTKKRKLMEEGLISALQSDYDRICKKIQDIENIGGFLEKKTKKKLKDEEMWKKDSVIKIKINQISKVTPLKCFLTISPSKNIKNEEKIIQIFNERLTRFPSLKENITIKKTNNEYFISIVSGFKRCSFCNTLRNELDKNFKIIKEGGCEEYEKGGYAPKWLD